MQAFREISGVVVGSLSVYSPARLKKMDVMNSGETTRGVSVTLTPFNPPLVPLVMLAVIQGAGESGIAPVTMSS